MQYLLMEWDHDLEDEPYEVYCELDDGRRERRRVEFYKNGVTFYYGREGGNENALSSVPYPEDLRELVWESENAEDERGRCEVRVIPSRQFNVIWDQALERPNGFTGMYF